MNLRVTARWVGVAVAAGAAAWFVWPSPYRYIDANVPWTTLGVIQFREHRITGTVDLYVAGYGWRRLRENESLAQRIQRLGNDTTPP